MLRTSSRCTADACSVTYRMVNALARWSAYGERRSGVVQTCDRQMAVVSNV